jgi:hypothetical protein
MQVFILGITCFGGFGQVSTRKMMPVLMGGCWAGHGPHEERRER